MVDPTYFPDTRPATSCLTTNHVTKGRIESFQRETKVLNLFIALKVCKDVMFPPLHALQKHMDIFDIGQPRSWLEDLVRELTRHRNIVITCYP
ncbi:hypothetical protein EDB19DRAFT_514989 [Suillus lakei]|nr:hypothetical protein EDB19DRAFT_514989 [Suillus lakei]